MSDNDLLQDMRDGVPAHRIAAKLEKQLAEAEMCDYCGAMPYTPCFYREGGAERKQPHTERLIKAGVWTKPPRRRTAR